VAEWDHATALRWFDETFAFSDLYRGAFIRLRVDGPVLHSAAAAASPGSSYLAGPSVRPYTGGDFLHDDLGVAPKAHRNRMVDELASLLALSTARPAIPTTAQAAAENDCVVCQDATANHAAIFCGHWCLCGSCAAALGKAQATHSKCPLCRQAMSMCVRIFSPGGGCPSP